MEGSRKSSSRSFIKILRPQPRSHPGAITFQPKGQPSLVRGKSGQKINVLLVMYTCNNMVRERLRKYGLRNDCDGEYGGEIRNGGNRNENG